MEFLVTTTNAVTFNNKELRKATNTVLKLAVELVNVGEITPDMSANEISRVVKSHKNPEPDEHETDMKSEQEIETIPVWDKDRNEYAIPIDVLKNYAV